VTVLDLSALITVREAARVLGTTRQAVTYLLRRGRIPRAARVEGIWLIEREAFLAYATTRNRPAGKAEAQSAH
jgi:excisionase family DNA binding protein